jgi:hypothetical protein
MTVDPQQRAAEIWALADDVNLAYLLAWRLAKVRAEAGGFNGLVIGDLTDARATLDRMIAERRADPSSSDRGAP